MPSIPLEIWQEIVSHLAPEEVRKLYSVNQSLFNIAMNERYKKGFVGALSTMETHKSLVMLIDPHLASRVRTFTLEPADLCRMLMEPKPKQYERKLSYMYSQLRKSLGNRSTAANIPAQAGLPLRVKPALPAETAKKHLKKIMQHMKLLTTLTVEIRSPNDHRAFQDVPSIDFIQPGWVAFGGSLTALDLRIPLEVMARVLPRDGDITLPNLRVLSMQIRDVGCLTGNDIIFQDILLPFLHSLKKSLQFLVFDIGEQVNALPLLLNMQHLLSLELLHLQQYFSKDGHTDLTGLGHLLRTHQAHLKSLSIDLVPHSGNLPPASSFFSQDCFRISLPELQHLSISLHQFPAPYKTPTINYVHHFASTLESLDIGKGQKYWSLENVRLLTGKFRQYSRLKELKIRVADFDPALLRTFSNDLASLQILHLHFRNTRLKGHHIGAYTNGYLFPEGAEDSFYYPNWHLKVLNIRPGLHLVDTVRQQCKQALLRALPTVHTFCGLGREVYLASPDYI